jgi:hypothetical protein
MKLDIISNAIKASNWRLGIQYTWGCVHGSDLVGIMFTLLAMTIIFIFKVPQT